MGELIGINGKKLISIHEGRNRQLFNIHVAIQGWDEALQFKHRSWIKQFYNDNGIRINSICVEVNMIIQNHYVLNNPDRKVEEPAECKAGPDGKAILLEGKTEKDYHAAWKQLMDLPTVIKD